MKTFQDAKAALKNRESKKVANRTYWKVRDNGIALRLHDTDIVLLQANGDVTLNTGGWATMTTRDRMCIAVPVYFSKGLLYVTVKGKAHPIKDGMTVTKRGRVISGASEVAARAWQKKVNTYANTFLKKLFARELPAPSGGDCWYCAMQTSKGENLGDVSHSDHIREHVKEGYYVPSLVVNACAGFGDYLRQDLGYFLTAHEHGPIMADTTKRCVRSAFRRYVGKHTGVMMR